MRAISPRNSAHVRVRHSRNPDKGCEQHHAEPKTQHAGSRCGEHRDGHHDGEASPINSPPDNRV